MRVLKKAVFIIISGIFLSFLSLQKIYSQEFIPAPKNLILGIIKDPEYHNKNIMKPWLRIKTVYWPDESQTHNYKCIQIPISWTKPKNITPAPYSIDSYGQLHAIPSSKGYFEEIQLKIDSRQRPYWNKWATIKGADYCPNDQNKKVSMLRPAGSNYDIAITEDLSPNSKLPIIAWNNNDAGHAGDEPYGDYYFRIRFFKYSKDLSRKYYSNWSNVLKIRINPDEIYKK